MRFTEKDWIAAGLVVISGRKEFSPHWPAVVAAVATFGLGTVVMITSNQVVLAAFILASAAVSSTALGVGVRARVAPAGHRRTTGALR